MEENTFKVNGVKITLSDEEVRDQQRLIHEDFRNRKETLINKILEDRNSTEDYIRKKVLDEILSYSIITEEDYERVEFMYNDGRLRSNEEVHSYDLSRTYKIRQDAYNKTRHKVNTIAFLIPFLFTLVIFCLIFNDIMFFPVALLFALIVGYIGMMIGYKINVDDAKNYELDANDPNVIDEKRKLTSSAIGGTIAAGSIIHNTKKAVKDITNVDSWKELK